MYVHPHLHFLNHFITFGAMGRVHIWGRIHPWMSPQFAGPYVSMCGFGSLLKGSSAVL